MENFRQQFAVNVFGTVELTQALLPLLIASKGIIVNHTSQSPYGITALCGAYAASKAALATYTDVLRIEVKPFDVRVMELVTGGALSNITADMKPPYVPEGSLYELIRPEMMEGANPKTVRKLVMEPEKYARRVVGDVLSSWGPPIWTWRGTLGTTMWVVWILKCSWKGCFDGLIARACGLHLLKGRIREQEAKKQK
jgi:1-acylglycerone phosphate reductase